MSTRLVNRNERLETIERLLFENPIGLRAVEIADACGVDRRTIYRDISTLMDNGLPIYQKGGRFCINREYYLATVRLNLHEVMAMFMAVRVLSHHVDEHNPHVLSALKKLGETLPDLPARHINDLSEAMQNVPVDPGFMTVLEAIIRAWGEQHLVKLWYSSSTRRETIAREFATYFVEVMPNGAVYAIGYDSLTQRIRAFKLRRVKRVRVLRTEYQVPAHFDPTRYLAGVWGGLSDDVADSEVVLKVSAEIAPRLKQQIWYPTQRVEKQADGSYLVYIQVTDWHSVIPWIRSWGAQVEVLRPQSLRDELLSEAKNALAMYDKVRSSTSLRE